MIFAGLVVLAELTGSFSVGAVNCGAFHYGDTNVSASAYAGEWKRLAAENPTDVFFYEDVGRGTDLPGGVAVPGLDIRASVRSKPLATDVIDLPKAIDVGGVERRTPRYRALRLTYPFAGGRLAVYGVHLVAEGHIRAPKPAKGGLSFSQRLRQRQFAALLEDAERFDHAIICGDFNAQKPSEYDIFIRAGFVLGNCSARFGAHSTLRNIPADNIILSSSLDFDDFRIHDGYRLNTDHFPVCATVKTSSAPRWAEVTQTAKPWVYNWWMASAVDEKGLENQCAELEKAGFGGFHVIPIYGAKGYESQWRDLLSPEWVEAWNLAVRTARKHGLGVDLTMGSGWCFGGPWVTEADAASSGMRVKRSGPGGHGYMIDPFSPQAMSNHVAQFEAAFGRNGTAERPRAFYHDSYEYYGAVPKCGGEATDWILKTFSVWTDWCRTNGYLTRNEGHGGPVNWLDFYALADIPETEMFGPECRDILVSKFASSAAHVTGKRLVSSESCTWIGQHFGVPLAEYKRFIDRLFLAGVNHVFYHGCCYSPVEAPWPGWCFYASSEMNWRNPIWRDVKFLNAYIARCQAMFQACEPDEDTLVYWPFDDYPVGTNGTVAPLTVHNASGWFRNHPIGETAERLRREGRAFDYVSDRQLQTLALGRYADLVVPPCTNMSAATRAAIGRFVRRPVRTEPFPAAGLCFTRMRRGDETVYFLANTNAAKVVSAAKPSAQGAMWWMDPMTGEVRPSGGTIELEAYASGFLVVKEPGSPVASGNRTIEQSNNRTILPGPWTLTPVCGGPILPPVRIMETLSTWSRNADGSENPFSGTMRYTTTFNLLSPPPPSTSTLAFTLDLGRVEQSARVRINGKDVGFAVMEPYRIRFDASVLKVGRNVIEIEVTSVGQNRLRQLGKDGVKWAYFEDVNMMDYRNLGKPGAGEMGFDAATMPLCDCGLLGPVSIML